MSETNEKKKVTPDGVYVVRDGKRKRVTPPESGFGKQTIIWQNGKPIHVECSYTEKLE